MGHLHYGEQFAVVRCSFFKIYYFSLKSSRYGKKTVAVHAFSDILGNIQSRMARNFEASDQNNLYKLIFRTQTKSTQLHDV